jgi:glucose-6-phosphate isomerase, archaeal
VTPTLDPFTTLMDFDHGSLLPGRASVERRLSDMAGYYLAAGDLGDPGGDSVIYRVHAIPVPETNAEIQCSTTVLEPGRIGDEYHMTKGHFHEIRDRSEVYVGLAGEGRLVMATEDGRHAVEPLGPGTVSYVPGGWAHRSVNVGDVPLVFFAAYVGDAGHDYGTIAGRGLPVMVVAGDAGPDVVPNPRYTA